MSPDFRPIVSGWFRRQLENPCGAYFLYFRPSVGEIAGELRIETEAPDGFQLADNRRISPGWTTDRARRHIYDVWRTLPILAEGRST